MFAARVFLGITLVVACPRAAHADPPRTQSTAPSGGQRNANNAADEEVAPNAENPFNPAPSLGLIDLGAPLVTSSGRTLGDWTNRLVVQGIAPVPRYGRFPAQIIRVHVPVVSLPASDPNERRVTGLGDIQVFDLFMTSVGRHTFGAGPLMFLPTATSDRLRGGGLQVGAATGYANLAYRGALVGALVQLSTSAIPSTETPATLLQVQPFAVFQLTKLIYARTTANWVFNVRNGNFQIPLGAGLGAVVPVRPFVINAFIEPEVTIFNEGPASPVILKLGLIVLYMPNAGRR